MGIGFPELSELLNHDSGTVRLVARVLYSGQQEVHEFALNIQIGCLQIAENYAANVIAELGRIRGDGFADAYAQHPTRHSRVVELHRGLHSLK